MQRAWASNHNGYTVRFEGMELWGEAADPTTSVSVDAWEAYLESR
jgi:nitrile hydratase